VTASSAFAASGQSLSDAVVEGDGEGVMASGQGAVALAVRGDGDRGVGALTSSAADVVMGGFSFVSVATVAGFSSLV
jgi:hypothetical protein